MKKLESKAKIRRRLLRLWKEQVRKKWRNRCAITNRKNKEPLPSGKLAILNCHHIESAMNPSLRYDPKNGILLAPGPHKFSRDSFHRSPVWSMAWLQLYHPEIFNYVLRARLMAPPDLNDREVLAQIERRLTGSRRTK